MRCEYCKLPSRVHLAPFQIDHIIARQHEGVTVLSNLALSCLHCNVRRGPNIAGIDNATGEVIRLFNPRTDAWSQHFVLVGAILRGLTPIGRVTIHVLGMNEADFVDVRSALIEEQVFETD